MPAFLYPIKQVSSQTPGIDFLLRAAYIGSLRYFTLALEPHVVNEKVSYFMPLLRGFLVLVVFLLVGESLKFMLQWPLSGGVSGMLLLTLWLVAQGRVNDDLAVASRAHISVLILLIMPGVVGVFFLGEELAGQWLALAVAYVAGTGLSVLTTFLLLMLFTRKQASRSQGG